MSWLDDPWLKYTNPIAYGRAQEYKENYRKGYEDGRDQKKRDFEERREKEMMSISTLFKKNKQSEEDSEEESSFITGFRDPIKYHPSRVRELLKPAEKPEEPGYFYGWKNGRWSYGL